MMLTDKHKLELIRSAPKLTTLELIEAVESACQFMAEQEKKKLLPRCFADYQPNHEHDRKCEWCAVSNECRGTA